MKSKKGILYTGLLLLGIVLFCIGGFIIKGEELKSVSGTFIGIGAGLFGMSIAQIIMLRIADKNPSYKRKMDIETKDERNIFIGNKAKAKAFDVMGVVFGVLMLIYALINVDLWITLLLVGAYLLVYVVYAVYLYKYTREM